MKEQGLPLTRDLVFVGGGHAHALALRSWGMKPLPGVRVTVINPGPTAPYSGMLPGHIAGHYAQADLEIDLLRLCRHAGARLIQSRAVGIDRARREISIEGRGPVAYDVASIDVGIHAQMQLPGFAEHGLGAKPLDLYAARWRQFLSAVEASTQLPQVAVIGGGVAGCELALAMAHALRQIGAQPEVTVVEAGADVSGLNGPARRRIKAAFVAAGVTLKTGAQITAVEAQGLRLGDGALLPAALVVGAAGAFAHAWIAQTDLPLQDGFIEVGPDLGVRGDPALFAVGDCAHMGFAPRPKAGVFAVRAAPVLLHNLRAALGAGQRRPFRPQRHYLKLISLGGKTAMAEKFGLAFAAPVLWCWKDRIDRKFMEKFTDLPEMIRPAPQGPMAAGLAEMLAARPLCGGCGAKVGPEVLQDALEQIRSVGGPVLTGVGDDAAVLAQPGGGFQVLSTDHLRGFVEDPHLMAQIAAVHALGDVWAMGAQPQVALASLVLPQMSPALQRRSVAEITAAARRIFDGVGAQLVGGHTTMGAELTIGFTVTGTRASPPITTAGAQAGDALVLTRPIGSGVILAAEMQGQARGVDVTAALALMAQPQQAAAALLAEAHAMTDVTGFGLAGHLQQICTRSGVQAEVWQAEIPVYAGARELAEAGVASSLMPANRAFAPVKGSADPLLHDPQTAGGLLAALPENRAHQVVAELRKQGQRAAVIGRLSQGAGEITLR